VLFTSLLILGQAPGGGQSPVGMVLIIVAMFAVMYFIVLRPQQKQAQVHKAMLAGLVKGDDVVTQGGLIGKIHTITDRVVTLDIGGGVKVRVLKSSVQGKYSAAEKAEPAGPAKGDESKKEEK